MTLNEAWFPVVQERLCPGGFRRRVDGFARTLLTMGYPPVKVRRHVSAAIHLGCWMGQKSTRRRTFSERALAGFFGHLPSCRCPSWRRPRSAVYLKTVRVGVQLFLRYLRDVGILSPIASTPRTDLAILVEFSAWMIQHRGMREISVERHRRILRVLFAALGADPARYTAHCIREFVLEGRKSGSRASAKTVATSVRVFLRWAGCTGRGPADLERAVPTVANWQRATLPKYLPSEDVERLIEACDQGTPRGLRNRAVMLLLARLGLRAGDVVGLRQEDIDWQGASLRVSGKGRREVRLPLPQDVGDALLAYLERGRPVSTSPYVFLRVIAPVLPLYPQSHTISSIVAHAQRRAGLVPRGGARVLRHSAATTMLRSGSSLQDIAQVLRHKSIETTTIYAKVDVNRLREIAAPWPEVGDR